MPALSPENFSTAQDGSTQSDEPVGLSGMVTFLFSDIEGSTRLWEEQPGFMPAALARHDMLMQSAIEAAGGRVFKTVGDAFHAVFEQPEAALSAALTAQTALHTEPWTLSGAAIRVRIALHAGRAEQRGGDYFGAALSRSARLLASAHGGQTLLSEAVAALLPEGLPAEARLRSLGRHRLKDLAQPQEIFQVLAPLLPDDFPPLRTLESFPHNLPAQLTSFIGRETEMAAARESLRKNRLLTLVGTGGSGKTRLALQVAADALDDYADGVWLVELAALSDPDLVAQEVAGVLGVREESEKRLRQTLIDTLRPKSLLLVLDNCEHLVEAVARLADSLLRVCPTLTVLATSREALGIGGEAVLPLPSLGLPSSSGSIALTPEVLAGCEAVRLFVERATAALPTFRFSAGNAAAVASVCARLDGIPLALELAAARVKVLTAEQIDGRLDDRFRLLSGGSRTALPRQQTLRALVDWSYDLLAPAEQHLFCRLSVFAGSWSLEAAETVCAGGDVEEWEVLDLLSRLVAKSLVVVEPPEAGQVRYHLLESIRSYTRERLAQTPGETEALARKHRDFFLALAEEAEPELTGANQVLWLNRLEGDMENLRAALSFARSERDLTLPRLAGALSRFWYGRSYLSEGMGWLEAALIETKETDGPVLGKVLNGAGMLSECCGDYDRARDYHEQDLALRRSLDDPRGIARALGNLSINAGSQKHYKKAEAYGRESLAQYQALGDRQGTAYILVNLGVLATHQADYLEAARLYREALAEHQNSYDAAGSADALHNLGELLLRQSQPLQAQPYFRDSLLSQRTVINKQRISSTLTHLAVTVAATGDHARVCFLWGAATHLLESGGIAGFLDNQQYQAVLDQSRSEAGETQFQLAWSQSHRMNTRQIIDFVLKHYPGLSQDNIAQ